MSSWYLWSAIGFVIGWLVRGMLGEAVHARQQARLLAAEEHLAEVLRHKVILNPTPMKDWEKFARNGARTLPLLLLLLGAPVFASPPHCPAPPAPCPQGPRPKPYKPPKPPVPPKQQRAYLRSYCTLACSRQHDIPIYRDVGPPLSAPLRLNKPLIKQCMTYTTNIPEIGQSPVCPGICPQPYNAFAACVPEIVQTTSCGPVSVCRLRPEYSECGPNCFIASMTCAAGKDVFFGVRPGPGLTRVARNTEPGCTGTFPFPAGDLWNELYRNPMNPAPGFDPPHLVCPTCCPQGTDFDF
jgi:hypothetical protein